MTDEFNAILASRSALGLIALLLVGAIAARGLFSLWRWIDHGRHWQAEGPRLPHLLCLVGRHRRARRHRYRDEQGVVRSRCRRCRAFMEKRDERWRVVRPPR